MEVNKDIYNEWIHSTIINVNVLRADGNTSFGLQKTLAKTNSLETGQKWSYLVCDVDKIKFLRIQKVVERIQTLTKHG